MKTISRKTVYTIQVFSKSHQLWAGLPGLQFGTRSSLLKQLGVFAVDYVRQFSRFRIVRTYTSVTKETPMKFRDLHTKIIKETSNAK